MAMAPTLHLPTAGTTTTPVNEKLAWEKELLGIYVSGNPLDAHEEKRSKDMARIGRILEDPRAGFPVSLHALATEVKTYLTKSGEKMAFVTFEDKTGSIEAVIFPKLYKEQARAIVSGTCVHLKGKVSIRNGETTIAVDDLKAL
jgi:DNA polymerase III subunit alpha